MLCVGSNQFMATPLNVASIMVMAATMGGFMMYGARLTWEKLEPWMLSPHDRQEIESDEDCVEELLGVDVSQSVYMKRDRVVKAVEFAATAHAGQMRKTGQPYVTHCIETALIVESLLSPKEEDERAEAAIIAALLHDVIDDAGIEAEEVYSRFGNLVGSMVTKVSQLSATNQLVRRKLRLDHAEQSAKEANRLRAMIVTMVSEPLVIVIKLADRLHNMRTVYALAPDKQRAVAEETQRVWCSLAERLGMFAIKSELEDLCFAVLQPSTFGALRADLDELWGIENVSTAAMVPQEHVTSSENEDGSLPTWLGSYRASIPDHGVIDWEEEDSTDPEAAFLTEDQIEVRNLIQTVLPFDASTFNMEKIRMTSTARRGLEVLRRCAKALLQEITTEGVAIGLEITVHGRVKSLYSSFRKMARKGVPLSEVYDVRALRVVVDDNNGRCKREAIEGCYKVLPAVHRLWRKVPGEDDDYIAVPKPSGYQSLHTAVIGPGGVPMEVQIRTSTMHEEAEYGKAAHWAYKERPIGGFPASNTNDIEPENILPGHPILRISPSGKLRDGVVVSSESAGNRLLVAVSHSQKVLYSGTPLAAAPDVYSNLYDYVLQKGYFIESQGDMNTTLELFTLCSDGKYHRLDRFGHKLATVAVPLQFPLQVNGSVDLSLDEDNISKAKTETEISFMNSRIKLLRSMIEWGVDVEDGVVEEPSTAVATRDIMVLVWPSGKIMRLPRGTTAGWVLESHKEIEGGGTQETACELVNVNNRLLPKETTLNDGDYVVLTNESIQV